MTFRPDVPISGASVMLKLVAASLVVAPPMIANAAMAETMARNRARPQHAFIFPPHPFYPRPPADVPPSRNITKGVAAQGRACEAGTRAAWPRRRAYQSGCRSKPAVVVRRVAPDPSAFATKTSGFVELRRVLVNAIFRPSRENVGSLSSPIAVVRRVAFEPFVELMLQRSWPEPPARLLARMILAESGDQAGSISACFVAVSWTRPVPFVFIVQR